MPHGGCGWILALERHCADQELVKNDPQAVKVGERVRLGTHADFWSQVWCHLGQNRGTCGAAQWVSSPDPRELNFCASIMGGDDIVRSDVSVGDSRLMKGVKGFCHGLCSCERNWDSEGSKALDPVSQEGALWHFGEQVVLTFLFKNFLQILDCWMTNCQLWNQLYERSDELHLIVEWGFDLPDSDTTTAEAIACGIHRKDRPFNDLRLNVISKAKCFSDHESSSTLGLTNPTATRAITSTKLRILTCGMSHFAEKSATDPFE